MICIESIGLLIVMVLLVFVNFTGRLAIKALIAFTYKSKHGPRGPCFLLCRFVYLQECARIVEEVRIKIN